MDGFTCRICGRFKSNEFKMSEIPIDNLDKVSLCSGCIKAIMLGISNYQKLKKKEGKNERK